jgi:hypoxanthine phosphoribosyltransferase|tara:strand:- start:16781 stop:17329 length:549 start_codon:yes stop_codon:yes gene_type:complete
MIVSQDELKRIKQQAVPLFTPDEIAAALERLAAVVNEKFSDKTPLLLCVMNGAMVMSGHLLTRLTIDLHVDFVHVSRYRGATTGADLVWRVEPEQSLRGRSVILLDDIFDEGKTLAAISAYCRQKGAAEVYTVVLINKQHDRKVEGTRPDLFGLEVDDRYVFGFGLDYRSYFRNLDGIYAVS